MTNASFKDSCYTEGMQIIPVHDDIVVGLSDITDNAMKVITPESALEVSKNRKEFLEKVGIFYQIKQLLFILSMRVIIIAVIRKQTMSLKVMG